MIKKVSKKKLHFVFKKYKIILKYFAKNTLINFCVPSAYSMNIFSLIFEERAKQTHL